MSHAMYKNNTFYNAKRLVKFWKYVHCTFHFKTSTYVTVVLVYSPNQMGFNDEKHRIWLLSNTENTLVISLLKRLLSFQFRLKIFQKIVIFREIACHC